VLRTALRKPTVSVNTCMMGEAEFVVHEPFDDNATPRGSSSLTPISTVRALPPSSSLAGDVSTTLRASSVLRRSLAATTSSSGLASASFTNARAIRPSPFTAILATGISSPRHEATEREDRYRQAVAWATRPRLRARSTPR
jgi:hypothetical protein